MENPEEYLGQTLDHRYQLISLLGQGGMGTLFVARHALIGKRLAVKIVDAERVGDHIAKLRLFREAEAAAAIGHPAIIDVMDVGLTPIGEPYLVMEYLDGEDLANYLARVGTVDLATACAILEPVLQALSAAHTKGIVHRDIKPANVFLCLTSSAEAGQSRPIVKLIDFGIAMLGDSSRSRITTDGAMLGTPSYMSPEQARGTATADGRTDLYGVGVILYELLTGELPFAGINYNDVIHRIIHEEVEFPEDAEQPLDETLRSLLRKALSKEPQDRFQSAREFLQALEALHPWAGREAALITVGETLLPVPVSVPADSAATQVSARSSGDLSGRSEPQSSAGLQATQQDGGAFPWVEPGPVAVREPTAPAVESVIAPSRRAGKKLIGGLALGAVLALALFVRSYVRADPPSGADVGKGDTSPSEVRVTISGLPADAVVRYDGEVVTQNPFPVSFTHTIMSVRVEAPGYEAFNATLVPTSDTTVRVNLRPVAEPLSPFGDGPAAPAGTASAQPDTTGPAQIRSPASSRPGPAPARKQPPSVDPAPANSTPQVGKTGRDSLYFEKFE